jgi:hypothetical protein
MAKPTFQDATLMLQLAHLSAASGLQKANAFLWSDKYERDYKEFVKKFPAGTDEFSYASQICGWFETLGTLFKYDLFNRDLLFDWLLVSGVWDRIKGFALGVREEAKEPKLYENFEAMAKAQT